MFKQEEFMGKRVLSSSLMDGEDVVAFFTTRDLPLKSGEREDLIEEIENNKKLVCEGLNIPLENLVIPVQTHSDNIEVLKLGSLVAWKNKSQTSKLPTSLNFQNTDALVTNESQIALALNFADCVPLIFYDPVKKVVACAHAGWRGTASKIGVKTVQKMVDEFGSKPKDIIALIGPAIGKCCFEVGEDVKERLLKTLDEAWKLRSLEAWQNKSQTSELPNFQASKYNLNLKLINKFQLLAMGVEKIDVCEYCTSCQNELFFSYRKENGKCARHSAVIIRKK